MRYNIFSLLEICFKYKYKKTFLYIFYTVFLLLKISAIYRL